jgi:succinate-semialdehyde dehydrogenase / glutarate-semialdehyde dehydrogenase
LVITKEETFGPVAPLYRFKTDTEARGARIRHRWHQRGHHLDRDRPLWRHEGKRLGREGSKYGIEEFLEVKYLCMGGIDR